MRRAACIADPQMEHRARCGAVCVKSSVNGGATSFKRLNYSHGCAPQGGGDDVIDRASGTRITVERASKGPRVVTFEASDRLRYTIVDRS